MNHAQSTITLCNSLISRERHLMLDEELSFYTLSALNFEAFCNASTSKNTRKQSDKKLLIRSIQSMNEPSSVSVLEPAPLTTTLLPIMNRVECVEKYGKEIEC